MALNKGKHTVVEIDGVRCSVVETGLTAERAAFLKGILQTNGFEVKTEAEKAKDGTSLDTFALGVTDVLFNTPIQLYMHKLKRNDGKEVTLQYWNQWQNDPDLPYWMVTR
jgi:hypothetical protein